MIRINPKSGGWLEVVCGPMFSGKSEEMIRRLRRAEIAGQRIVIFKPRIDDRYDAADVVSHAGIRMRAVPVGGVAEIVERARGFEVVGVDETQFFEQEIVGAALALADGGARVIAAGLDRLCPPEDAQRLARETKGKTELLLVEDGNHVAHNRFYKYRGRSADWMARQLGAS